MRTMGSLIKSFDAGPGREDLLAKFITEEKEEGGAEQGEGSS